MLDTITLISGSILIFSTDLLFITPTAENLSDGTVEVSEIIKPNDLVVPFVSDRWRYVSHKI